MSPKKIDSKKLVENIFETPRGAKSRADESRLDGLLSEKKPQRRLKGGFRTGGIIRNCWKQEFGALDLGSDSIKFMLLERNRKYIAIKDFQLERLPAMAQDETNPQVREQETMNALVKIASNYSRKIKVGIALNAPSVYMDHWLVSGAMPGEERQAVENKLSESRFINPDNSFYDFLPLSDAQSANPGELFVVAAPKELVYRQFELVQSAGFRVLSVETNSLATLEALRRVARWGSNDRVLILDIGARYADVTIVIGNRVVLSRTSSFAGNRFTQSVQEALGVPRTRAEQMKRKYGLKVKTPAAKSSPDKPAEGPAEGTAVAHALLKEVNRMLAEVEKSFTLAFANEAGADGPPVQQVYLMGGGESISHLAEHIEERWKTQVCPVSLCEGLPVESRNLDRADLQEMNAFVSVSLGVALRIRDWKILPFGMGAPN